MVLYKHELIARPFLAIIIIIGGIYMCDENEQRNRDS